MATKMKIFVVFLCLNIENSMVVSYNANVIYWVREVRIKYDEYKRI